MKIELTEGEILLIIAALRLAEEDALNDETSFSYLRVLEKLPPLSNPGSLTLADAASVPQPASPEWRREGDKFRARWKQLFPAVTDQELILLDNCAGLQLLRENDDEAVFFTPGEAIGLDKRITVEVTVSKDNECDWQSNLEHESGSDGCGEGCAACADEKNMREIQITFDHGTDAGGGRSDQETFYRSEDLAEWFRSQIDS